MCLDLLHTVVPQPLLRVLHQEPPHEVGCLQRHHSDPRHVVVHLLDLLEGEVLAATPERGLAHNHLVEKAPERPPVHRRARHPAVQNLRRGVLRRAHEARLPLGLRRPVVFRPRRDHLHVLQQLDAAKVSQLEVALIRKKQVLWLQVAVHHALLVQELQHQYDLGRVEPDVVHGKLAPLLYLVKELALCAQLQPQVERVRVLKSKTEVDQPLVSERVQHPPLPKDVLRLPLLHDVALVHDLQRVALPRAVQLCLQHLGKGTGA
mmetsp:Transcript_2864/g.9854  ORF Transcript_2864/g.9854 Transcript_2864/m.9854 type:complete len:263 (+) Transcript_2864:3049-3837(+)